MISARIARSLSTSAPLHKKVAVLGAAGGIGQPLALLLKLNQSVTGMGFNKIFELFLFISAFSTSYLEGKILEDN